MNFDKKIKTTKIEPDDITDQLSSAFDYKFDGVTNFVVPYFEPPDDFSLGLIVGGSGSGKSSLLEELGFQEIIEWDSNKAICSHFGSGDDARERLGAVGLNSIPTWMKPFHVLSNGEKYRAEIARKLKNGALIDEFTSVVDRDVAKSCSNAIQRYIRNKGMKGIVFASCHYDIIEWLRPDWIFDTDQGKFTNRGSLRRPEIVLELFPASTSAWEVFKHHHYLSSDINRSSRCWVAVWNGRLVGFTSVIAYPSGTVKNAWRGHRTVLLPEFQGLGLGVRMSDAMGKMVIIDGGRFFSKTANHQMGGYRNNSSKWKPTSKNMKCRQDYASDRVGKEEKYKHLHIHRFCYSHEYIGDK